MSAAPPTYGAESPPPSYDEAVKKLEELVGPNPTAKKVLEVANGLSSGDVETLTQNHGSHFPIKTDKEKEAFAVNAAKTASSPEVKGYVAAASSSASRSAKEISAILQRLQVKIAEVDTIHQSGFGKPLQEIQTAYQKLLGDSRLLAIDISQYGTSFDDVVIKFCADTSIPLDERRKRIQTYINKAKGFETQAKEIDGRFNDLVQSFATLVSQFSNWARDKEGELIDRIKHLEDDLKALRKKLSDLKAAQASVTAIGAAALPVTGLIGACAPPLSTFVLVGGLIAAGVSIATVVGLIIAANRVENEIENKTSEKQELEKQLEKIRQTRQELEQLGSTSLTSFMSHVQVLASYWKMSINDAHEIQSWLQEGAMDADKPPYMEANLQHAVHVYKVMADYLREYAQGIEPN